MKFPHKCNAKHFELKMASYDDCNNASDLAPSAPPIFTEEAGVSKNIPSQGFDTPTKGTMKPFSEKQLLSLYTNDFARIASEFSEEFLAQESGLYFANCPLIDLLNEYLRSRLSFR